MLARTCDHRYPIKKKGRDSVSGTLSVSFGSDLGGYVAGMNASGAVHETALTEEDALRAQMYRFLAHLLCRAPRAGELAAAAEMTGDDSELGRAIQSLARIAGRTDEAGVEREYHDLFIGVGRGELLPYGSYYLTGFLHEKPLARLRNDMARYGIERRETVREPEDHIAAVFEMMAGLIEGDFGEPLDLDGQRDFFEAHVGSWAPHFFKDLEGAKNSVLFAAVGSVGRVFMDIEEMAFTME